MLANALLNQVPRPTFAEAFALYGEKPIRVWIASRAKNLPQKEWEEFAASLPQDGDPLDLRKLLEVLAYGFETPDAFAYAKKLQDNLSWPVDGALVGIFLSLIDQVEKNLLRQMTTAWMMKNAIRFDKKEGDTAVFNDTVNNIDRSGTVKSIDRVVATGIINSGGKDFFVRAEHVKS